MARTERSVAREVIAFAVATCVVLLAVGIVGVAVLHWVGTVEATRDAKRLTEVSALGIVQPRLDDGILRENVDSQLRIDTIVNGAVVRDPVVRVKIWDPAGARDGSSTRARRTSLEPPTRSTHRSWRPSVPMA